MTESVALQRAEGVRCSDADRERTSERLRTAAAEGYLTMDELEDRLTGVYAAKYGHELDALVLDLPRAGRFGGFTMPGGPGTRLRTGLTMLLGRPGSGRTRRRVFVALALGMAVLALLGAGVMEGLDLFEGADDDAAGDDAAGDDAAGDDAAGDDADGAAGEDAADDD